MRSRLHHGSKFAHTHTSCQACSCYDVCRLRRTIIKLRLASRTQSRAPAAGLACAGERVWLQASHCLCLGPVDDYRPVLIA